MKKEIFFYWLLPGFLISCNSIKESKYSRYNEFSYANEQPTFHFKNDTLAIEGEWNWASGARAIPKLSYIPKMPRKYLRGIAKEHGSVLFATWAPERNKFSRPGYVPVTKADVQFSDKFNKPFYIVALINDQSFKSDTAKYKSHGRNNDYQFALYSTTPQLIDDYWIMEVIASGQEMYYDFVCIMDSSFISTPAQKTYQADLFFEDIQQRFLTQ